MRLDHRGDDGAPSVEAGDDRSRDLGVVVGPAERDEGLGVATSRERGGGALVERATLRGERDDAAGDNASRYEASTATR